MIKKSAIIILCLILSACVTTHKKQRLGVDWQVKQDPAVNFEAQTKVSNEIFLEPVSKSQQVVFVTVDNSSQESDIDIEDTLKAAIIDKGYSITENQGEAYFILNADILQAGVLAEDSKNYAMLLNLELSQKMTVSSKRKPKRGRGKYTEENGWRKYTTYITSLADRHGASFEQAKPAIIDSVSRTIADILL
jgi:hypothetical protein